MDPFFNIFNFYVLRTHKRISAGKEKAPIMQNTKVRFEQIFASVFPLT